MSLEGGHSVSILSLTELVNTEVSVMTLSSLILRKTWPWIAKKLNFEQRFVPAK